MLNFQKEDWIRNFLFWLTFEALQKSRKQCAIQYEHHKPSPLPDKFHAYHSLDKMFIHTLKTIWSPSASFSYLSFFIICPLMLLPPLYFCAGFVFQMFKWKCLEIKVKSLIRSCYRSSIFTVNKEGFLILMTWGSDVRCTCPMSTFLTWVLLSLRI